MDNLEERLHSLRKQFANKLGQRLEVLHDLTNSILKTGDKKHQLAGLRFLSHEAHLLAGNAGTFGFSLLGKQAKVLESFCLSIMDDVGSEPNINNANAALDLSKLGEFLSGLMEASRKPDDLSINLPIFNDISTTRSTEPSKQKDIIVVDDDVILTDELSDFLQQAGYRVLCLDSPQKLPQKVEEVCPAAIIIDIACWGDTSSGHEVISLLRSSGDIHCPVIYLTALDDFSSRLSAVRTGFDAYLSKPVDLSSLLDVLDEITAANNAQTYRVLLVDDDREIADFYTACLRDVGIEIKVIVDPVSIFSCLPEFLPDVILMDVNLPMCDGFELSQIIRQKDEYTHIPIIFITASKDESNLQQAVQAGGDGFLVKPITPDLLVSSVVTRAKRSRKMKNTVERLNESESFFSTVTNVASEAIISTDEEGHILFWNSSAQRILGYRSSEVLNANIEILFDDVDCLKQAFANRTLGSILSFDAAAVNNVGNKVPVEVTYKYWASEKGRYYTFVVHDLSHRENIKLLLREQEIMSDAVLENTTDAIVTADTTGTIKSINTAGAQIFGYEKQDLVGQPIRVLMPDSYGVQHDTYVKEYLKTGVAKLVGFSRELKGKRKDGSVFPIEIALKEIKNNSTQLFVATCRDISDRKAYEDNLHKARLTADKASQAKSDFLSSMSHELRTPLNAILGFGRLLQTDAKNPLIQDHLMCVDQIVNAGGHLLSLINEILDLSRIESGEVVINFDEIEPVVLIKQCISLVSPLIDKKNIVIQEEYETAAYPKIRGDRVRLKQVLLNLLSNAIKYSEEASTVVIKAEINSHNSLRIAVKDYGKGIAPENHERIFEPFSRLGAEKTKVEGTGIGLTLTRKLVELMLGNIGFESEAGKGSTFWFDMPIALHEVAGLIHPNRRSPDDGKLTLGAVDDSLEVLYVEDDPSNLMLMELIAERMEVISLLTAPNAELGIELALARKPSMIFMDINLPGMSGFEALQKLKKYRETQDIPVVALSAEVMEESITKGEKMGFFKYLTKPIVFKEIQLLLKGIIDERSARKVDDTTG